ncbi:DUF2855 family protein [Lentibacter algarum]|uniref:DUF2855 family protein n=1 Tax=Lentibacter algarum TaxID=576131 RepID=UPI001C0752D4|nr:DUF2855 family protein [Lentibacter algarum]MBU2981806.1 DUF2855 family protein [Lentibacter algarum]
MSKRILVEQGNITVAKLEEVADAPLASGEVRLALESFALTANNVTYAATGFVIGYWSFFPTGIEGQGIVPVWGTATVVESASEALQTGTRLYGFFPMAEQFVMQPEREAGGMIEDKAAHRAELPAVYIRYVEVSDKGLVADGMRALLQPLLATSYLLFDWLQDNAQFGAEQVIIGSASSKTGLGLCKFLAEDNARKYKIVGLTSASNKGFVEGLNACDEVLTYDEVEQLRNVPSVYVDMAGNAEVKLRLHEHLAENVKHSAAVGTSHWDKFAQPANMPGAKPKFFFAPAQIAKRREEWGAGVIERKITEAWKRIAADADWMTLKPHDGLAEALPVYKALAEGKASPKDGHVIVLKR